MRWLTVVPLIVFLGIAIFLGIGLTRDASHVPSPLVDRPVPAFELPLVSNPDISRGPADFRGEVYLLNVWATWCVSCRQEHEVLMQAAEHPELRIVGLDYKDRLDSARRWLDRLGNPYTEVLFDDRGQVGLDLGVYGTPETFVIDREGIVRYKHTGPLTRDDVEDTILPMVRRLRGETAS